MKRFLLVLLMLIIILPAFASSYEDDFREWNDSYYNPEDSDNGRLNDTFRNLTDNGFLSEEDYLQLDYYYERIFMDENASQIKDRMRNDFKTADLNDDSKLDFEEFKVIFGPIQKYFAEKEDFLRFKDLDRDDDGKISPVEFDELAFYIVDERYLDMYSLEELVDSEFINADENGDEYLNFTEYEKHF